MVSHSPETSGPGVSVGAKTCWAALHGCAVSSQPDHDHSVVLWKCLNIINILIIYTIIFFTVIKLYLYTTFTNYLFEDLPSETWGGA